MKKHDPFLLAMTRDNFNEEIERFKDDNIDHSERYIRDEEKWGKYFFLDYQIDNKETNYIKWVREPNLNIAQLSGHIERLIPDVIAGHITDLRVQSEDKLNELNTTWCEEKKCYINDEITLRDKIFGSRYSSIETNLMSKIDSLSRKNVTSETEKEDYQEWKQRVIASPIHNKYVPFADDEVEVRHGWVEIKGR